MGKLYSTESFSIDCLYERYCGVCKGIGFSPTPFEKWRGLDEDMLEHYNEYDSYLHKMKAERCNPFTFVEWKEVYGIKNKENPDKIWRRKILDNLLLGFIRKNLVWTAKFEYGVKGTRFETEIVVEKEANFTLVLEDLFYSRTPILIGERVMEFEVGPGGEKFKLHLTAENLEDKIVAKVYTLGREDTLNLIRWLDQTDDGPC